MNEFEIVKHIMMVDHVSYDELSARLGYKSKSSSYITLSNKHIYVDTLRKFLEELGYDLIIRKKGKTDGGYVIDDDNAPSPLRFHDMSMNFGIEPEKRRLNLSRSERIKQTEELKKRVHELTPFECEEELREIWSTINPVRRKMSAVNEYEGEYINYRKEFRNLYNEELPVYIPPKQPKRKRKIKLTETQVSVEPVTKGAKGKIITEDKFVEKDMSVGSVMDRAKAKQKTQSNMLAALVADFQMDD